MPKNGTSNAGSIMDGYRTRIDLEQLTARWARAAAEPDPSLELAILEDVATAVDDRAAYLEKLLGPKQPVHAGHVDEPLFPDGSL